MARTLGTLVGMTRRSFLGVCMDALAREGSPACVPLGFGHFYAIGHPEQAKQIVVDNRDNWRRTRNYELRQLSLGKSLLTTDGPEWRARRNLIQPVFHRTRIDSLAGTMTECVEAMLDRWSQFPPGHRFDLMPEMLHLALDVITRCTFGSRLPIEVSRLGEHFDVIQHYFRRATFYPLGLYRKLPFGLNRQYANVKKEIDDAIFDIVKRRRKQPGDDILSGLLDLKDDAGNALDIQEIRDEVMGILHAGHETVMLSILWTLYLLGQHQSVRERLEREIEDVLGMRTPTVDELSKLPYAGMVLKESMRLYPPAPAFSRTNLENEVVGGMFLPAGSYVNVLIWAIHTHPEFWERPDEFDPERFARGNQALQHSNAYMPFAAGPHRCIGHHFASLESLIALVMITQRFRLAPLGAATPVPRVTLRPAGGMPMLIHPRWHDTDYRDR